MIKTINDKIKSELVEEKKFFADLSKMYLSKSLIERLRDYYTEKERKKLNKNKKNNSIGLMECESDWPICLENIVKNNYYHKSPSFYLYRGASILGNFKPDHFVKKRKQIKKNIVDKASVRNTLGLEFSTPGNQIDTSIMPESEIKFSEKQLLIERSKHICKFGCDANVEKREREKKRKNMLFMMEVAELKKPKKPHGRSVSRNSELESRVDNNHKFTLLDGSKPLLTKKKTRDDIDLQSPKKNLVTNHFDFSGKQN